MKQTVKDDDRSCTYGAFDGMAAESARSWKERPGCPAVLYCTLYQSHAMEAWDHIEPAASRLRLRTSALKPDPECDEPK